MTSGTTIQGDVIEKTDEYLKIKIGGIEVKYYADEIEEVVDDRNEKREKEDDGPRRADARIRRFKVHKRFILTPRAELLTLQFIYPLVRRDIPFQKVSHIRTSPKANALVDDPDGNTIASFYFSKRQPGRDIVIDIYYDVALSYPTRSVVRSHVPDAYGQLEPEAALVLSEDVDNPDLEALSTKIMEGLENPYDKVRAIYDYIADHFRYEDKRGVSGRQSVSETLLYKKGNCSDITRLFVDLAVMNGVPARQVVGVVYQPDPGEKTSVMDAGHAWAEVYLPVYGWVPADATFGLSRKEEYFMFSYDIHLRECYGKVVSEEAGSLYRGSSLEVRTPRAYKSDPVKRSAEITIEEAND